MLKSAEWRSLAYHAKPRFQQRLIEGPAIVGDHHFEFFEMFKHRTQLTGFFAKLAHEKLPDSKALRCDAANADEERIGTRSASQASCFGIEKAPLRGRHFLNLPVRNWIQKIVRKVLQVCNPNAAVPPM